MLFINLLELKDFNSLLQLIVLINFAFAVSTKKFNKTIAEEIFLPVNWIQKRCEKLKNKIKIINHSTQLIIFKFIRKGAITSKSKQIQIIDKKLDGFKGSLENTKKYYDNILSSKTITSALSATCLFSGLYAFLLLIVSGIPNINSNLNFLDSYLVFNFLFIIYVLLVILKDCCGLFRFLKFKKYYIIITFLVFILIGLLIYFSKKITLLAQYFNDANLSDNECNIITLNIYKKLVFSSIILSFFHFIIYFFRLFMIHLVYSIIAIFNLLIIGKKITSFEKKEYKQLDDFLKFLDG